MDSTLVPIVLDCLGTEFVRHGITTHILAVLFLAVLLNILVPTASIAQALWINGMKQDFCITKAWPKPITDLLTTTKSLT